MKNKISAPCRLPLLSDSVFPKTEKLTERQTAPLPGITGGGAIFRGGRSCTGMAEVFKPVQRRFPADIFVGGSDK